MARFICSVHAPDATPRAFALIEQMAGPTYAVRDLRRLEGDGTSVLLNVLSSEPQYAGQTTVVTTGGQKAADALRAAGPSAVAVTLLGDRGGDADAHDVSAQELVDTFERLYRAGAVEIAGTLDAAASAVDAIYHAADFDAAADDSDRDGNGDLDDADESDTLAGGSVSGSGPSPTVVEQSGSAENVSTEVIDAPVTPDEASAAAVDGRTDRARTATATGTAPDLGDHEAEALALALGCWYGEVARDTLPTTDKADEAIANRIRRRTRRN